MEREDYFTAFMVMIGFNFLYFLIPSSIFYSHRKKASIWARVPLLTLTTALGLMLKINLVYANQAILNSPWYNLKMKEIYLMFCLQEDLNYSIFEILIFLPIAMRFHYINEVN